MNKDDLDKSNDLTSTKNHPCLQCSSSFANKSNLNRHIKGVHSSKDSDPEKKRIDKEEEKRSKKEKKSAAPKKVSALTTKNEETIPDLQVNILYDLIHKSL